MVDHLTSLTRQANLPAYNSKQEAIDARTAEEAQAPRRKIQEDRKAVYEVEVDDAVQITDNQIAGSDVKRIVRVHHPEQDHGFSVSPARVENYENTTRFTF